MPRFDVQPAFVQRDVDASRGCPPATDTQAGERAELGVCFDGDADRCAVVDETGGIVGGDHLTAWLARRFLAEAPSAAIIYDLRSSRSLVEAVEAAGGRPVRSRVGHVFMKAALTEQKAVFGGELSGHFYFRDNFFTDSGAIAFASVVSAVLATLLAVHFGFTAVIVLAVLLYIAAAALRVA